MNKSILLISSILFSFVLVASAGAVITINGCRELNQEGETYRLSADFTWDDSSLCEVSEDACGPASYSCLHVSADDITLDGNGKTITGDDQFSWCRKLVEVGEGATGFKVENLDTEDVYYPIGTEQDLSLGGLEVEDVNLVGCSIGIYVDNWDNGDFYVHSSDINCDKLDAYGIYLKSLYTDVDSDIITSDIHGDFNGIVLTTNTHGVSIRDNTIDGDIYGILIENASHTNEITRNTITGGNTGVRFEEFNRDETLSYNDITGGTYGVRIGGTSRSINIVVGPGTTSFTNFISGGTFALTDASTSTTANTFSYASPYGGITWTNPTFLNSLSVPQNLTASKLYVTSNIASLDASYYASSISTTSASVSLSGSIAASMDNPYVARNGVECNATTTPACTSLPADWSAATLTWVVSGWSNYTIMDEGGTPPGNGTNGTNETGGGTPDFHFLFLNDLSKFNNNDGIYCPTDQDTISLYFRDSSSLQPVTDGVVTVVPAEGNVSIVGTDTCNCSSGVDACFPCQITFEVPLDEGPFYFVVNYNGSATWDNVSLAMIDSYTGMEYLSVDATTCYWIRFDTVDSETGIALPGVFVNSETGGSAISDSSGEATIGRLDYLSYDWDFSKSGYDDFAYSNAPSELMTILEVGMVSNVPSAYVQPFTPPQNVSAVTGGFLNIAYAFVASPFNWIMLAIIILLGLGLIKLLIGAVTGQ